MVANVKIAEVMTSKVISVHPDDMMDKVGEVFRAHHIHHIPVVDQHNQVVGIVSKDDYNLLCDHFTLFRREYEEVLNKKFLFSLLVKEVMTKQVMTLHFEDPISLAVGIFRENLFRAIPIVDDDKALCGILTTYDLLTYAFSEPLMQVNS